MAKAFKPGQRVIIIKPNIPRDAWTGEWARVGWNSKMTALVGKIVTIRCRNSAYPAYNMKEVNYNWHSDWLAPVDEYSNQYNSNSKCKWCKDIKLKKKFVASLEFEYQYCPECGR